MTSLAELRVRDTRDSHESSACFEYKILLKSSHTKKYLPNFSTKKSQNRKFQTPNNPLIIPVTWNPRSNYAGNQFLGDHIDVEP